jgi:hypothetical protein
VTAIYHSWTANSSPSSSVTVATAAQTVTFTSVSPSSAAVGGGYTVSATGGGSGNAVVYSTATTSVCTLNGAVVSFLHAGTCTVDADQAGSTYYSAAPTSHQSTSVSKAPQVVAFTSTSPSNATVATGGASGNQVALTIDSSTTGVCTISGGAVTYQHVGTCIVDANQAGNSDYLGANQVQQAIAVGKGSQAVNFTSTPPASPQVGGTYTPTASSSAGLTVAITLDGSSTGCTIASGTVTFTAAGTCVIDANQAGNLDFLAATQVQQSFAVVKKSQAITFTSTAPSTAVYNGTYAVTATATSGLAVTFSSATTAVCTSSGATITFVGTGSCTVNADQGGDATWAAAPRNQQTFTVSKAAQSITFTAPATGIVGGSGSLSVSASSGLTVSVASTTTSVCTISGTTVTYVSAGTCTLTADQAGNANYLAALQVSRSITVTGATKFAVSAGATQTVGTAFNVTITAQDVNGATFAAYAGSHPVVISAPGSSSPSGATATLPTTANFTSGVATVSVTLVKAETGRTLTATEGSLTGTSAGITVNAGTAARLAWTSVAVDAGTLSSPCLFTCTDTALGNFHDFQAKVSVTDSFGNTVSNVGTGHTVKVSTPTSPPGDGGAFTAPTAGTSVTLTINATGSADSVTPFVFHTQNGNWNSDSFTAATLAGTVYTSATASVTKA